MFLVSRVNHVGDDNATTTTTTTTTTTRTTRTKMRTSMKWYVGGLEQDGKGNKMGVWKRKEGDGYLNKMPRMQTLDCRVVSLTFFSFFPAASQRPDG
jgi:hypothetical protein